MNRNCLGDFIISSAYLNTNYTIRTAIHLHYLLTQHSTIEWMHKWGTDRSKQDQQEEVRSGVSPRFSGDMQHVPCQRGVTLLQLYIQLKRTACPAEFRKELKAVFCWKIIWLKTANTTQILRVNDSR